MLLGHLQFIVPHIRDVWFDSILLFLFCWKTFLENWTAPFTSHERTVIKSIQKSIFCTWFSKRTSKEMFFTCDQLPRNIIVFIRVFGSRTQKLSSDPQYWICQTCFSKLGWSNTNILRYIFFYSRWQNVDWLTSIRSRLLMWLVVNVCL